MKPTVRDRLVMPILLPLVILLVIAAVLYGFSRILLSVTATAATVTAIVVAAGVMAAASMAASRRHVRLSTLGAMLGVTAGIAMLAGGIALAVVGGGEEGGEERERPVVQLAAVNIQFDPRSLTVPAGTPFTIAFDNQDSGVQHNVDIFDNEQMTGTPLFEGDLVTGVATANYQVDALEPGAYFFRCVVHPPMTGEIQAEEGGGGETGGGGGEPGGGVTVVAQNIAFDTSTIELPAGEPSTITFDNRDAGVQHNIAIYTSSALEEELFNGELVTGPATVDYQVPALDAGEYYFHCVVHPNMSGNVTVSGGGGAGGATGAGGTGGTGATGGGPGATGATGPPAATGPS